MTSALAIKDAEKKLAAALRYEKSEPDGRDKIILACKLTDAHARKIRRLIAEGATVSPQTKSILDYLERAS